MSEANNRHDLTDAGSGGSLRGRPHARSHARLAWVASAMLLWGTHYVTTAAAAGHETVLYSFLGGTDGSDPAAALVKDSSGALYGTTVHGGGGTACSGGCGTVYKLTPSGAHYAESVLYRFQGGGDGAYPEGALLLDSTGRLLGTATNGGSTKCSGGCGTVFALSPQANGSYTETTLYQFLNSPDGANPQAALLRLKSGTLLGTTTNGGSSGYGCYGPNSTCGTVFSLKPTGTSYTESVAYTFQTPADASGPQTNLLNVSGSIFGVGFNGGTGGCGAPDYRCGTVFSLTPLGGSGYSESVLTLSGWNGDGGPDPIGGLAKNASGMLFGVAHEGPTSNGGVFALTPASGGYSQAYIHTFGGSPDGRYPSSAPTVSSSGVIYGATPNGGASDCDCGVVYALAQSASTYTETILWSFERGAGGTYPVGGLLLGKGGMLIGAASQGGSTTNCSAGCGTVYKITQ